MEFYPRGAHIPQQRASAGPCAACVTFWVRQSRLVDNLDSRLLRSLREWLRTQWAFDRVIFAATHAQERQRRLFEEAGLHCTYMLPRLALFEKHTLKT